MPQTVTLSEDSVHVLSAADFPFYDPEGEQTSLVAIQLLSLPTRGKLYYDADGGDPANVAVLTSVTQLDQFGRIFKSILDAGKLWFAPDADGNGSGYASFGYAIQDSQGLSNSASLTFNVTPVNDAPQFSNADNGISYDENETITLDHNIAVSDVELGALNGGLGDYAGAVLTLRRSAGASADDVFGFDTAGTSFVVAGDALQDLNGNTFATFSFADGLLTVTFGNGGTIPTSALVDDVLQHVTYRNTRDDPPNGHVNFTWQLRDGNSGTQGSGGEQTGNGNERARSRSRQRRAGQSRSRCAVRCQRTPRSHFRPRAATRSRSAMSMPATAKSSSGSRSRTAP